MSFHSRNITWGETMSKIITEDIIERALIKELSNPELGYSHLNCYTKDPDDLNDGTNRENKKQIVLYDILLRQLQIINPQIPLDTLKSVAKSQITLFPSVDIMLANYDNYTNIRNGIKVEFEKNGKREIDYVKLIDFNVNNIEKNKFTVCSQMWIKGETYYRRPSYYFY